jgi:hypothetical protein
MKRLGWDRVPPSYADNQYILEWWTPGHDAAVQAEIARMGWHYGWHISDAIEAITPPEVISRWQDRDPLCKQYAHYNIIMYFGIARAQRIGLESAISPPRRLSCIVCGKAFDEAQYPHHLLDRLGGRANLRCCADCPEAILRAGADVPRVDANGIELQASRHSVTTFLATIADVLRQVPPQRWVAQIDWPGLTDDQLRNLVEACIDYPTSTDVKREFGSWLGGLIASGVLADGTHKGRFGARTVAIDGHVCNSLAEKTVDDWLTSHGVPHTKEPAYPEGAMRADFEIGGILVEYFGLAGQPAYDEKIEVKRQIVKRHGIQLVEIYPKDLASWGKSQHRIARALGLTLHAQREVGRQS